MTVAHAAANLVLFNTAGLCHPRQKTAEAPFCLEEAPRVMCAASRAIQVLQPDPVLRPSLAPTRIAFLMDVALTYKAKFVSGERHGASAVNDVLWRFKFSQLRGSSDDQKTRVKLLFENLGTRQIEMK
ncbi:hypothetical protein CB1_001753001, partial [Camelus ferus]